MKDITIIYFYVTISKWSFIINNKYLSKLPSSGFDCLIVEPGTNTLIYPSQFDDDYKNITIDSGSLETRRNEIAYFSVKSNLRYSVFHVSGESVIENKAVDSLKGKGRGKMEIIKLEWNRGQTTVYLY